MRLRFPDSAVVVVAGVPGAGKTTLLRRAVDRARARVVDTDDRREAGARGGPVLYAGHYLRIAMAVLGRSPVVVHTRGTNPRSRRVIALLARLRRRPAHLLLLDASRWEAEAGQRARGRAVEGEEMTRQMRDWLALLDQIERGEPPRRERWASITVLDRAGARSVEALEFEAAPAAPRGLRAALARS